jgi:hypothetical protein
MVLILEINLKAGFEKLYLAKNLSGVSTITIIAAPIKNG